MFVYYSFNRYRESSAINREVHEVEQKLQELATNLSSNHEIEQKSQHFTEHEPAEQPSVSSHASVTSSSFDELTLSDIPPPDIQKICHILDEGLLLLGEKRELH